MVCPFITAVPHFRLFCLQLAFIEGNDMAANHFAKQTWNSIPDLTVLVVEAPGKLMASREGLDCGILFY